jgi:anti-anti-sigma factor
MKIVQNPQGDVMVLALSGKIMGGPDHQKFHTEVKSLIHEGHQDLLLDFAKVSFINSTGLGILLGEYTSLKRVGGRMKICRVNDRVRSIFYVTELHNVFEVLPDQEKGLAAFG